MACPNSRIRYSHKIDGCKSKGGLVGIAVATWTGGTGAISWIEDSNGYITGVTNSGTTTFYFQAQNPEKAFANVKNDTSEDRLAGGYAAEGAITYVNNDWALRVKTSDQVNAQTLIITKDNMGNYRLFGTEYGCFFNSDEQSGTKLNDLNQVVMSWTSKSSYSPKFMTPALAEGLFNYDTVLTA